MQSSVISDLPLEEAKKCAELDGTPFKKKEFTSGEDKNLEKPNNNQIVAKK